MTPANQRIVDKLDRLQAADPKCLWFGVDTHRYRLGAKLAQAEIDRLASSYRIALPNDYAAFLAEVGNGGAGPGYGLQRFGRVASIIEIPVAEPRGPHRIVQKTRHCTKSRQDLFDSSGNKVDPFDVAFFDSIKCLAPDGDSGPMAPGQPFPLSEPLRNAEGDSRWKTLDPKTGTLQLADYGCGMSAHLILNGPYCGHVWLHDPNAAWFVPFNETATVHYVEATEVEEADITAVFTFTTWYEHWMDHALQGVSRHYEDAAD